MTLLEIVKPIIKQVYRDKPVIGELALVQAILESNLIRQPSRLAVEGKNLFGIKGRGTDGIIRLVTKEYINKKWLNEYQDFVKNKSYEDSVIQHRNLMNRPRYVKVWESKDFLTASVEIWKAGYATDPNYPYLLQKVHHAFVE